MKKVLVFGVFDGLHEGHRAFLRQAKQYGDHLMVALARDEIVKELKGKAPQNTFDERKDALLQEDFIGDVVEGDEALGTYEVLKRHRPDFVILGYDQNALKKDLEDHLQEFGWHIEVITADPYEPDHYHTSLLNNH